MGYAMHTSVKHLALERMCNLSYYPQSSSKVEEMN